MTRRDKRWPIWKIATGAAALALIAAGLFWGAALASGTIDEQTSNPTQRSPQMTVSSFLLMLALICVILWAILTGWLVLRVREALTPAWKRGGKRRRR